MLTQCYRQQISDLEISHNKEIMELQNKINKVPPNDFSFCTPLTMPREEGEGSESVEDSSHGSIHPVSLEQLLSTDSDHGVGGLRKQLSENESKVAHLTALLSDAEQDLAKHVQMNVVLKEEIRRQQRSIEREKHAENLEYLKNVVFKVMSFCCFLHNFFCCLS